MISIGHCCHTTTTVVQYVIVIHKDGNWPKGIHRNRMLEREDVIMLSES